MDGIGEIDSSYLIQGRDNKDANQVKWPMNYYE